MRMIWQNEASWYHWFHKGNSATSTNLWGKWRQHQFELKYWSNCHECYIREVRSISKQYFEMKFESTFFNRFKPFTKNFSTILIQQSKNFLQRNLFCSQSVKIYGLRHMIVSFHNLQMHIHINVTAENKFSPVSVLTSV